jgi:hypothetical protein
VVILPQKRSGIKRVGQGKSGRKRREPGSFAPIAIRRASEIGAYSEGRRHETKFGERLHPDVQEKLKQLIDILLVVFALELTSLRAGLALTSA